MLNSLMELHIHVAPGIVDPIYAMQLCSFIFGQIPKVAGRHVYQREGTCVVRKPTPHPPSPNPPPKKKSKEFTFTSYVPLRRNGAYVNAYTGTYVR